MTKLLTYPDQNLRVQAEPVTKFDDTLKQIVETMSKTMNYENGIGLAAPQIDIPLQIITINLSPSNSDLKVLINPKIKILDDTQMTSEEGCLSIPGYFDKVKRNKTIEVIAQNTDGESFTFQADGLMGYCIQHEVDHLNGTLFIDYLSKIKQDRARRRVKKFSRI